MLDGDGDDTSIEKQCERVQGVCVCLCVCVCVCVAVNGIVMEGLIDLCV